MPYRLSPARYDQIARALPRPTAAQRARFLDRLAAARPWPMLLPADGGVPCTLLLNPRAGVSAGATLDHPIAEDYRAAFGYLDYATPIARGVGVLCGAELSGCIEAGSGELAVQAAGTYYILDDAGRAVPLPPDLLAAATCPLNAAVYPDAALLLQTLPLRVPQIVDAGSDRLDTIAADGELRSFAEEYTREELAGFICPTDREAWASRWLQGFQQLYAPRHAQQRARLERALDGLLAWLDGVDKA